MRENQKHRVESEGNNRPCKISKIQHPPTEEEEEEEKAVIEQEMNQNGRIQRYLVAIEYIGTRFSGSQKQPTCRTVVGALEEAFCKFVGQPVSVSCSSRTDAGVHALSNVCHVDIERISKRRPGEVLPPHEPVVVRRAVNHFLQKHDSDLMVIDVQFVPSDFHARFKAQERTYFYRLLSGPEPLSTFEKDRAWHVSEELNLPAMREACRVLVGRHDFSSFRAAGCQAKSPIRTLDELIVGEVIQSPYFPSVMDREQQNKVGDDLHGCHSNPEADVPLSYSASIDKVKSSEDVGFGKRRRHRCLIITARARSFLYHQVRLLVGVLKAVGTGNLTITDVERILEAKSVTATSPMAPACGLYLGEVKYDLPSQ